MLNLKNSVKMHTVTNGKPPTFAEFQDMAQAAPSQTEYVACQKALRLRPKDWGHCDS